MNPYENPKLLQELFQCNPDTGRLTHRANRGRAKAGAYADTSTNSKGYRTVAVRVNGKQHNALAHRVVWVLTHGYIPDGAQLDHIDGNKLNNRPDNLRLATSQQNNQNRRTARGFTWNAREGRWQAQLRVGSRCLFLGLHDTELLARAEYLRAKRQYHPSAPIH